MAKKNKENKESVWDVFAAKEGLSDQQREQFVRYLVLLTEWNKKFNITTITNEASVIKYHFQDSLRLGDSIDMSTIKGVADVGSGGGFPGIPLKIKYPDLFVVLIENNQKKVGFLQTVIDELGLTDIEVCPLDWRTFLRNTEYEIVDLFLARASLQPEDLMRVFSPAWGYNKAQLVYFATHDWKLESPLKFGAEIVREFPYEVGSKKRKLVFFAGNKE